MPPETPKVKLPPLINPTDLRNSIDPTCQTCSHLCTQSPTTTFMPCSNCVQYSNRSTFNQVVYPGQDPYRISKPACSCSTTRPLLSTRTTTENLHAKLASDLSVNYPPSTLQTRSLSDSLSSSNSSVSALVNVEVLQEQNTTLKKQIEQLSKRVNDLESGNENIPKFSESSEINSNQMKTFVMEILQQKLPPKEVVIPLVEFFFEYHIDDKHLIHRPTFKHQHEAFWSLIESQDFHLIDPFWISLLFMVLASSVVGITPSQAQNIHSLKAFFQETKKSQFHRDLFQTARRIRKTYLMSDDPLSGDRIIGLQILCLGISYLRYNSQFDLIDGEFLPTAVSVAYDMKLDSPEKLKSPTLTVLEVELRKRMWWDLCSWDTNRALNRGRRPFIMSYYSNIPFPCNCNDEDLNYYGCDDQSSEKWCDTSLGKTSSRIYKILNGVFTMRSDVSEGKLNLGDVYLKIAEIDRKLFEIFQTQTMKKSETGDNFKSILYEKTPDFHRDRISMEYHFHRAQLYLQFRPLDIKNSQATRICVTSLYQVLNKALCLITNYREIYYSPTIWPGVHVIFLKSLIIRLIIWHHIKFTTPTVKSDIGRALNYLIETWEERSKTKIKPLVRAEKQLLEILKTHFDTIPVAEKAKKLEVGSLLSVNESVTVDNDVDLGLVSTDKEVRDAVRSLRMMSAKNSAKIWAGDEKLEEAFQVASPEIRKSLDEMCCGYLGFLRRERI